MTRRFAQDTTVPVERTQAEISKLLADHGATARVVGVDDASGTAVIMFKLAGRNIHVVVPLPTAPAKPNGRYPNGWFHFSDEQKRAWARGVQQQQERAVWRGMLLLLKAKLEAIEGGYATVEHEFLADVLLPNGATVGQLVEKSVEAAYASGQVPPLLPSFSGSDDDAGATPRMLPASTLPRLVEGGS